MSDVETQDNDAPLPMTEADAMAAQAVARGTPGWTADLVDDGECAAWIGVVAPWGDGADAYQLLRDASGGVELVDCQVDWAHVGWYPDCRQAMLAAIRRGSPRERAAASQAAI